MTIELVWQPMRGATQYRIEWDAGSERSERLPRAVVTEPGYVDTSLLPGTYRYWVVSVGPGGVSAPATIVVDVPLHLALTPLPPAAASPTPTRSP